MDAYLLVHIINIVALTISVAQLCVASSIFDFIVVNGLYYTTHDQGEQTILMEPHHAVIFFTAPLLSAAIATLTITVPSMPRRLQNFICRHPVLIATMHAAILAIATLSFAYCSFVTAHLSRQIGYYASDGIPQKFQAASYWYFVRLKTCTMMFGLQSIVTLSQTAVLYMRKECRCQA